MSASRRPVSPSVLVDGKLIADDWTHWKKGRTYFEEGSDEVVGTLNWRPGAPTR